MFKRLENRPQPDLLLSVFISKKKEIGIPAKYCASSFPTFLIRNNAVETNDYVESIKNYVERGQKGTNNRHFMDLWIGTDQSHA